MIKTDVLELVKVVVHRCRNVTIGTTVSNTLQLFVQLFTIEIIDMSIELGKKNITEGITTPIINSSLSKSVRRITTVLSTLFIVDFFFG